MNRSGLISKWWRAQEDVVLHEKLLESARYELVRLQKRIECLEGLVDKKRKAEFGIRLEAISGTDPVQEFIERSKK